jgi:hypothetical protein
MTDAADGKRDFFVSFNQADHAWATWIAWVLEEAGYSVFFQDWDFTGNFVLEMDRAHTQSRRTIAVLSPDYLASRFTAPEWAARFAQDATSEHDRLIPVRVRPCELQGLLAQIVYVDLVSCDEATARDKLVKRVKGIRLKPDEPPFFPGRAGHKAVAERPVFPAAVRTDGRAAAMEPLALATGRRTPPASWLVGAITLAAVVVVTTVWLLTSGERTVTATGGSSAVGGNVTVDGGVAAGRDVNTGGGSCNSILERSQLGEPVSDEDRRFLQRNCGSSPSPTEQAAVPPPNSPPQPVQTLAELDKALKKLVDANVAFQAPTKMKLSQAERVSVSLGVSQSREELEAIVRKTSRTGADNSKVESSPIKISNRMEAELTGVSFDIVPAGPQIQYISAVEPTDWTWQVKAKSDGDQILDLTLSALLQIDGKDITRKINTFHRTITVEVTGCEDVKSCLKQAKELVTDSKEIIAGALIPICGFLIAWFRKRRQNSRAKSQIPKNSPTKKRRAT